MKLTVVGVATAIFGALAGGPQSPRQSADERAIRAVVFALVTAGRIRHARFERRIEAVRIHGDIAIVMGRETVVAPDVRTASPAAPIERRFSHIRRRAGASWQLIARHANRVPPA